MPRSGPDKELNTRSDLGPWGEVKNPQDSIVEIWLPDRAPIGTCVSCPPRDTKSGPDLGHDEISTTNVFVRKL